MKKFKREGRDIYQIFPVSGWVKIKTFNSEDESRKEYSNMLERERKFKVLKKELFLPREIQGLFATKGGLWDVNIETDKMKKFRGDVYQSRRKRFSLLMKEQLQLGKNREQSFEDAYIKFIDVADNEDIILTEKTFRELYPDEKRQRSSW